MVEMGRLSGRVALVTGASRGIGAAVARRFAAEAAHVIAVARHADQLESLDDQIRGHGGTATLVPLDLTDGPAIDRLGGTLYERFGRLDILVGNAAVLGQLTPLSHAKPQDWTRVIDVNLTANWRLIRSFDSLLRAAPAGRAIFVTSGVTRGRFPYWGPYAVSKSGLEKLVLTYAAEVAKSAVRVNLIDPGAVRTQMRAKAMPGEDPMSLPAPDEITETFVLLAESGCQHHGEVIKAARL